MSDGAFDAGTVSGKIEIENKWSDTLNQFTQQLGHVGENFKDFGEKVKSGVEDPMGTAKEAAHGLLEELGPVGVGIGVVAVAATAVGIGLFEMASHAAEAGEGVLAFSRITGASAESIGALSAAAYIGGGSLDGLQGMLFQVQRRMDATGPAADKFDAALKDLNINAASFREADPTERINMLSQGMHDSAGNTTLMSDAIAVMGRGAMQNLPLLTKNFADLEAQGKALGYTWSVEDLEASEKLNESTAALSVMMSTAATTIGVALIPVMTDLAIVTQNLFGFFVKMPMDVVTGAFHMLTGAIGETALEEEKFGALQDVSNRLLIEAKKAGLDGAAAWDQVIKSMLEMGITQENVHKSTGESIIDIKIIAASLKEAETATKDYTSALERVNASWGQGKPVIAGITQELQDWVVALKEDGNAMSDIATVTGLTVGQINALVEAEKRAGQIADQNAEKLRKAQEQMDADADKRAKFEEKTAGEITKLWQDYNLEIAKATGDSKAIQIAAIDKWYADLVEKYSLAGRDTAEFYDAAGAIAKKRMQEIGVDNATLFRASIEGQQQVADNAQKMYDLATGGSLHFSQAAIQHFRDLRDAAIAALHPIDVEATKDFDDMNAQVMGLSSSFDGWNKEIMGVTDSLNKTAAAAIAAADAAQKMRSAGGSQDVTAMNLSQQLSQVITSYGTGFAPNDQHGLAGMDEAAKKLASQGYSFQEIVAYLEGKPLSKTPIGPRIPGFKDGGMVDIMVGEDGPEAIRVPLGTQVFPNGSGPGGNGASVTNNFYVNGTIKDLVRPLMDEITRQMKQTRLWPSA